MLPLPLHRTPIALRRPPLAVHRTPQQAIRYSPPTSKLTKVVVHLLPRKFSFLQPSTMAIRVSFLALLLLVSPFLQVGRCQSEGETEVVNSTEESSDVGIGSNDNSQMYGDERFDPAPGVETVCIFPRNGPKMVPAGEEAELLVGIKYDGEATVNVVAIQASVHLPFDHRLLVQNLTAQVFNNSSVPPSTQATFPYVFTVSKFLQPGSFDLVGSIVYEIDEMPYKSTFYNGTIEVVETSGLWSIETVFLVMLAIGLITTFGLWMRGQLQRLSKKSKNSAKVEVGTRSTGAASLDEWLQGTAYTQSQTNKSKKKK